MKRAIFPDSKSLQPAPSYEKAHPNISGSVNSTTGAFSNNQNIPVAQNTISPATQNTSAKNGNPFPFFALWCIIILIVALVIIFIYKKIKK
jgi:hypothetical protein